MRSDTNKQGAQGELHAKLLSGTTVPGTPHPEAAAWPAGQ